MNQMNQTNQTQFTVRLTDCVGRCRTVTVRCPRLQFRQILLTCMNSWDAVRIAEERWNKAQRLRKLRARARQHKLEASRVYETL